jgi:hypothetical protein
MREGYTLTTVYLKRFNARPRIFGINSSVWDDRYAHPMLRRINAGVSRGKPGRG